METPTVPYIVVKSTMNAQRKAATSGDATIHTIASAEYQASIKRIDRPGMVVHTYLALERLRLKNQEFKPASSI